MAYEINDLKGILILVLFAIPSIASMNINCRGKAFHCVNSTHFMICVDLGGGVSTTIDDFVIPCPATTMCHETNIFECEFPEHISTLPPPQDISVYKARDTSEPSVVTNSVTPPPTSEILSDKKVTETTLPIPEEVTSVLKPIFNNIKEPTGVNSENTTETSVQETLSFIDSTNEMVNSVQTSNNIITTYDTDNNNVDSVLKTSIFEAVTTSSTDKLKSVGTVTSVIGFNNLISSDPQSETSTKPPPNSLTSLDTPYDDIASTTTTIKPHIIEQVTRNIDNVGTNAELLSVPIVVSKSSINTNKVSTSPDLSMLIENDINNKTKDINKTALSNQNIVDINFFDQVTTPDTTTEYLASIQIENFTQLPTNVGFQVSTDNTFSSLGIINLISTNLTKNVPSTKLSFDNTATTIGQYSTVQDTKFSDKLVPTEKISTTSNPILNKNADSFHEININNHPPIDLNPDQVIISEKVAETNKTYFIMEPTTVMTLESTTRKSFENVINTTETRATNKNSLKNDSILQQEHTIAAPLEIIKTTDSPKEVIDKLYEINQELNQSFISMKNKINHNNTDSTLVSSIISRTHEIPTTVTSKNEIVHATEVKNELPSTNVSSTNGTQSYKENVNNDTDLSIFTTSAPDNVTSKPVENTTVIKKWTSQPFVRSTGIILEKITQNTSKTNVSLETEKVINNPQNIIVDSINRSVNLETTTIKKHENMVGSTTPYLNNIENSETTPFPLDVTEKPIDGDKLKNKGAKSDSEVIITSEVLPEIILPQTTLPPYYVTEFSSITPETVSKTTINVNSTNTFKQEVLTKNSDTADINKVSPITMNHKINVNSPTLKVAVTTPFSNTEEARDFIKTTMPLQDPAKLKVDVRERLNSPEIAIINKLSTQDVKTETITTYPISAFEITTISPHELTSKETNLVKPFKTPNTDGINTVPISDLGIETITTFPVGVIFLDNAEEVRVLATTLDPPLDTTNKIVDIGKPYHSLNIMPSTKDPKVEASTTFSVNLINHFTNTKEAQVILTTSIPPQELTSKETRTITQLKTSEIEGVVSVSTPAVQVKRSVDIPQTINVEEAIVSATTTMAQQELTSKKINTVKQLQPVEASNGEKIMSTTGYQMEISTTYPTSVTQTVNVEEARVFVTKTMPSQELTSTETNTAKIQPVEIVSVEKRLPAADYQVETSITPPTSVSQMTYVEGVRDIALTTIAPSQFTSHKTDTENQLNIDYSAVTTAGYVVLNTKDKKLVTLNEKDSDITETTIFKIVPNKHINKTETVNPINNKYRENTISPLSTVTTTTDESIKIMSVIDIVNSSANAKSKEMLHSSSSKPLLLINDDSITTKSQDSSIYVTPTDNIPDYNVAQVDISVMEKFNDTNPEVIATLTDKKVTNSVQSVPNTLAKIDTTKESFKHLNSIEGRSSSAINVQHVIEKTKDNIFSKEAIPTHVDKLLDVKAELPLSTVSSLMPALTGPPDGLGAIPIYGESTTMKTNIESSTGSPRLFSTTVRTQVVKNDNTKASLPITSDPVIQMDVDPAHTIDVFSQSKFAVIDKTSKVVLPEIETTELFQYATLTTNKDKPKSTNDITTESVINSLFKPDTLVENIKVVGDSVSEPYLRDTILSDAISNNRTANNSNFKTGKNIIDHESIVIKTRLTSNAQNMTTISAKSVINNKAEIVNHTESNWLPSDVNIDTVKKDFSYKQELMSKSDFPIVKNVPKDVKPVGIIKHVLPMPTTNPSSVLKTDSKAPKNIIQFNTLTTKQNNSVGINNSINANVEISDIKNYQVPAESNNVTDSSSKINILKTNVPTSYTNLSLHNSSFNDELEQHLTSTNHTITAEVQSHLNENDKQSNKTNYEQTRNITSIHSSNHTNIKPSAGKICKRTAAGAQSLFSCANHTRGKYADKNDCRKFYTCIGSLEPMVGICPNNTVFSEINKLCTRNLSHCVRNNQFHCLFEGRFSDFFKDNMYYICVRNGVKHFTRYKLQCQEGYHLNKVSVKCEKTEEISTQSASSVSEPNNDESKPNIKSAQISEKINSADDFECEKEGKFPYAKDCNKYYECTKIKDVYRRKIKKCAKDEVYDKEKKKCVESDSGEC